MKGKFCWFELARVGPPERRPGTEACRIRVPCICNEGCTSPTRIGAAVAASLRTMNKSSARRVSAVWRALARPLLIQPGALKCNPSRGWFIPRQCPPAGQDVARLFFMSLSFAFENIPQRRSALRLTRTYQHDRRHRSARGSNPNDRVQSMDANERFEVPLLASKHISPSLFVSQFVSMIMGCHFKWTCCEKKGDG